jgi:hypothetical protein
MFSAWGFSGGDPTLEGFEYALLAARVANLIREDLGYAMKAGGKRQEPREE